jgi:predicted DNA-binding protein with PD1-like motif
MSGLSDDLKRTLTQLYADPKSGFSSKAMFVKSAQQAGVNATQKQIKEWYDSQGVTQLFRVPPIKRSDYGKITCRWGRGCFQADLMDISKFSASNKGVTFLLSVIEVPTRYVWSFPLKQKTPTLIAPLFAKVIRDFHKVKPNHVIDLRTDEGSEFKGAVKTLFKKEGVMHTTTLNKSSMGMIESLHKVFWSFFKKWSAVNDNKTNFVSQLDNFVENYNNRVHSSVGKKPIDLFTGKVSLPIISPQPGNKLKIGDLVRIRREKKIFEKASFLPGVSDQVYKLEKSVGRRWILKNEKSGHELEETYLERQLVPIKQVDTEVRVEEAERVRNKEARVRRLNKQEPAFKGVQPKPKDIVRAITKPVRFFQEDVVKKVSAPRKEAVKKKIVEEVSARPKRNVTKPVRFRGDGIAFY